MCSMATRRRLQLERRYNFQYERMSSGALHVDKARQQGASYGLILESGHVKDLPCLVVLLQGFTHQSKVFTTRVIGRKNKFYLSQ